MVASGRGIPGRNVTPTPVSRMPAARDFHALLADACFVSPEELADCGEGVAAFLSCNLEFLESLGSSLKVRLLHAPFPRGLQPPLKMPFHLVVSLVITPQPPGAARTKARKRLVACLTVQH